MRERHPTLKDVAAEARVGVMTASRTFSTPELVAEPTRRRVEAAAERIGYRSNALARAMRQSRTGLVGVVVTNIANPFHSRLAAGIDEVLTDAGHRMLLAHSADDAAREAMLLADMRAWRVDGVIAVPALADTAAEERYAGLTTVFAGRRGEGTVAEVVVDDAEGARLATLDLIDRGGATIAFLGNDERISTTRDRLEGYLAAHRERGLEPDPAVTVHGIRTASQAAEVARALRALHDVDAFLGVNNQVVIGVLDAVADEPHPPLVAGVDDLQLAHLLRVPTTLVTYDPGEIGRQAATLLLRRIDGDATAPQRVVIPVRLAHHGDVTAR